MKLVWTTVCHQLLASLKKGFENINFHFQSEHYKENCQSAPTQRYSRSTLSILRATTRKEFPTSQMSRGHKEISKVLLTRPHKWHMVPSFHTHYSCHLLLYNHLTVFNESSWAQTCSQALLSINRSYWRTCKYDCHIKNIHAARSSS